ncbi:hypothetical protein ATANTOWER_031530 [Ataeniobius toweri]|uniref:Uncharacterized protein n=1 Tax=Ataeniobius toweri TaxID=208326 RepID=A0ABU7AL00_9TELE|nr:hypothetical protein [Ataeniobius toweri]
MTYRQRILTFRAELLSVLLSYWVMIRGPKRRPTEVETSRVLIMKINKEDVQENQRESRTCCMEETSNEWEPGERNQGNSCGKTILSRETEGRRLINTEGGQSKHKGITKLT